jgi:hypothetical protein
LIFTSHDAAADTERLGAGSSIGLIVTDTINVAEPTAQSVAMGFSPRSPNPSCARYLFAEAQARGERSITAEVHKLHPSEINDFARRVAGDEVSFGAGSYHEWLPLVRRQSQGID